MRILILCFYRNGAGHTAYVVAKDKNVRDAFRRFMAQHPSSYDYSAAKVPSPLTEEMERGRKEKAKKQREKVASVTSNYCATDTVTLTFMIYSDFWIVHLASFL